MKGEMINQTDFSDAIWRKSAYSMSSDCVEVAILDRLIGVRDSKDREGPVLVFGLSEWNAFVAGVRDGEFDLLQQESVRPR